MQPAAGPDPGVGKEGDRRGMESILSDYLLLLKDWSF